MNKQQEKSYIRSGGNVCPFCNTESVMGTDIWETDSNWATEDVRCEKCHEEWRDLYTLTGTTE